MASLVIWLQVAFVPLIVLQSSYFQISNANEVIPEILDEDELSVTGPGSNVVYETSKIERFFAATKSKAEESLSEEQKKEARAELLTKISEEVESIHELEVLLNLIRTKRMQRHLSGMEEKQRILARVRRAPPDLGPPCYFASYNTVYHQGYCFYGFGHIPSCKSGNVIRPNHMECPVRDQAG